MASHPQAAYEFGQFTLLPTEKRLLCDQKVVPLAPKVFDTLVLLVENQGRLIQKEELFKALWPNTVVEEQSLAHNISQLRKVLRDPAEDPKFVETIPKRGYRFIASVRAIPEPDPILASSAPSGAVTSTMQRLRWPRRMVLALLAAVLTAVTTAYVYFPRTGPEAARAQPAIHSLAVLPLENLSGDKEQEYFADGMTDALITDLAQVSSLRVISRTSAMRFKHSKDTLPQIGREMKVDAVVEGTVARAESRVRITAQLIEASSDHHLWAKSYERDFKDVLALQDEIAQDITEQIQVKLIPKERSLLMQGHTVDPEAYDAYLRGSYWWNQLTQEGNEKACDYFQKAVAKDPSYALAYVGVSQCFLGRDVPDKAREAIVKALALGPSLAEAHTTLATMKFLIDWDFSGSEAEHKQAIALNPNYAPAHHWYSFYLVAMGRLDEAMTEIERARDRDPYDAFTTAWLGQVFYHARRYDDALREIRRGMEMHPNTVGFYSDMADVYEQKKMFPEAFAARQQAFSLRKDPRVTALADAYKRSGYKGYLLKQAEFEEGHNRPYAAHCYALLNDEPRAIAALETAYNEHGVHGAGILFMRTAPEFDSIRSSPRFRDLVRRIGFPPSPGDKK